MRVAASCVRTRGAGQLAPAGQYCPYAVPRTSAQQVNHCASAECDDVQAVTGLLRQNRTVLISSELFGATTEPGQTFWSLHQLFAPLAELTVVMVHRHTMDW